MQAKRGRVHVRIRDTAPGSGLEVCTISTDRYVKTRGVAGPVAGNTKPFAVQAKDKRHVEGVKEESYTRNSSVRT
jgi:hypothetical protein